MCHPTVKATVKSLMAAEFTDTAVEYPGLTSDLTPPAVNVSTKRAAPFLAVYFPDQDADALEIGAASPQPWREDGVFVVWILMPVGGSEEEEDTLRGRVLRTFLGKTVADVIFEGASTGEVRDEWKGNWSRQRLGIDYTFDYFL